MTSRDFCFWLQGILEVTELDKFNERQTHIIKTHLSLVFKHEINTDLSMIKHFMARDFCFWLDGVFSGTEFLCLNKPQMVMISAKLSPVFKHDIDPSMGDIEHQEGLNNIHSWDSDPNSDVNMRC